MGDTPRTDEAQFGTGRISVDFARRLERELTATKHLLKSVLHQRTGPSGEKIEDVLYRENEPLLLKVVQYTRDQQ